MDVNQYLAHIQVEQPVKADITSLTRLQLAHLKTVPFENLDIHYGKPISLETEDIFEKVVVNQRGGFCYELNGLFYALLREIGFNAKRVSARVAIEGGGFTPEYDHLAIVVSIDGLDYLTDVGFGRFAVVPLPIKSGTRIADGMGEFQIKAVDDQYFQVDRVENEVSAPEYIFSMTERNLSDFREMCEFHQQSADSHFTRKKLISILRDDGRITLTDTQLKISGRHSTQVKDFEPDDFENYLDKYFGIAGSGSKRGR